MAHAEQGLILWAAMVLGFIFCLKSPNRKIAQQLQIWLPLLSLKHFLQFTEKMPLLLKPIFIFYNNLRQRVNSIHCFLWQKLGMRKILLWLIRLLHWLLSFAIFSNYL